jgi:hypothetical protein
MSVHWLRRYRSFIESPSNVSIVEASNPECPRLDNVSVKIGHRLLQGTSTLLSRSIYGIAFARVHRSCKRVKFVQ